MKTFKTLFIIIFISFFSASVCFARAGGAGGGSRSSSRSSSSSSRSSGSSYRSSQSNSHSSGSSAPIVILPPAGGSSSGSSNVSPSDSGNGSSSDGGSALVGFIIILLFVGAGVFVVYKIVTAIQKQFPASSASTFRDPEVERKYADFIESNPDFVLSEFTKKAEKAFVDIQYAWGEGNIEKVRRFISDGVYQRFATQIFMMGKLKQHDEISNVKVNSVFVADVDVDGLYDILHMGITASMKDKFISETDPSLNSPGTTEEFTEYWSFIRKRGIEKKDLYFSESCPQCSGPLTDKLNDTGKCPYCGTSVNSPDFDWVLSEITQSEDFALNRTDDNREADLDEKVEEIVAENDDFSVQLLEDKASNGYLQIMTAISCNEPERMRRFVSDAAYKKIVASIPDERLYFNRIFLTDVSLLSAQLDKDTYRMTIGVNCNYQYARLTDGKAELLDYEISSRYDNLVMERARGASVSKGSVYAHICPSCGAPVSDSLDVKCAYCGVPMNSPKNEWIITGMTSGEE